MGCGNSKEVARASGSKRGVMRSPEQIRRLQEVEQVTSSPPVHNKQQPVQDDAPQSSAPPVAERNEVDGGEGAAAALASLEAGDSAQNEFIFQREGTDLSNTILKAQQLMSTAEVAREREKWIQNEDVIFVRGDWLSANLVSAAVLSWHAHAHSPAHNRRNISLLCVHALSHRSSRRSSTQPSGSLATSLRRRSRVTSRHPPR